MVSFVTFNTMMGHIEEETAAQIWIIFDKPDNAYILRKKLSCCDIGTKMSIRTIKYSDGLVRTLAGKEVAKRRQVKYRAEFGSKKNSYPDVAILFINPRIADIVLAEFLSTLDRVSAMVVVDSAEARNPKLAGAIIQKTLTYKSKNLVFINKAILSDSKYFCEIVKGLYLNRSD